MNHRRTLPLFGLALSAWACDGDTGFRVPDSSSNPTFLSGRVVWPDGRSVVGANVYLVVEHQRVARVTSGIEGAFEFSEAPTGPAHVVINLGRGVGHVRPVEVYGGGMNELGDLVVRPLHLWPEVLDLRGVEFEERWTQAEGNLHSVARYPDSEWLVGRRERPGSPSGPDSGQKVVAISMLTGEERVLIDEVEVEGLSCCWATRDGVVALEFEGQLGRPVRFRLDGTRTSGAPIPGPTAFPWRGANTGRRYAQIYTAPSSVPEYEDPVPHQFVVLDLETLSNWTAPRDERPVCFIPWARVDAEGQYLVDGGCFPDALGEIEERLTLTDRITGQQRVLWLGSPRTSQTRYLRGFDVRSDGRVIAAIDEGGRTRFAVWDVNTRLADLELRDAEGASFVPACPVWSGASSILGACEPRFGTDGRLYVEAAILDVVTQEPRWFRYEFDAEGHLIRTFELGYASGQRPDGRLLEGPSPGRLEAWSVRGEDGFRQVSMGSADTPPEDFVQRTFLPADHEAVALSTDGTHVYYLVPDPKTGYTQLFRTLVGVPELGDGGER